MMCWEAYSGLHRSEGQRNKRDWDRIPLLPSGAGDFPLMKTHQGSDEARWILSQRKNQVILNY